MCGFPKVNCKVWVVYWVSKYKELDSIDDPDGEHLIMHVIDKQED